MAFNNNSWDKKTFGECAELVRNTCEPSDYSNMPYVGLEHIEEGTLRLTGVGNTNDVISTKSRFEAGDILFGKLRPYFRKVIRPKFSGLCSTDIMVVRAKEGIDQGFLFYWMASQEFVDTATRGSEGTKMPRAKWDFLQRIEKPIPSPHEQRAIAAILGSLDDKIELNQQMNQTLEAMTQELFKSWFVDFDPFRDRGMAKSPLGEIPKGWKVTSLCELYPNDKECVITGPFGSTLHSYDYRDSGTPLILVKHVNNGHIDESDLPLVGDHKLSELTRFRLKVGDIVFTRVGAVGRSALVYPKHEGWLISGQMLRVRIRDTELQSQYLAQLYLTRHFVDRVESHALGTTRPSLNTKILQDFKFVYPPPQIQLEFVNKVCHFNLRIQHNLSESYTLATIRDTLIPKLLSGEIRVKDIDKSISIDTEITGEKTEAIYTIGHSNHSIQSFINLLKQNKITAIADVRSSPFSKYHPQFIQAALVKALKKEGIAYVFLGKELGARPDDPTCYVDGSVDFEKIAEKPLFKQGIERLLKGKENYRIALLCAEKEPLDCHRTILVSRHLSKLGLPVKHILADGSIEEHMDTERRLIKACKLEPNLFDTASTDSERIQEAYSKRAREIAYMRDSEKEEYEHAR